MTDYPLSYDECYCEQCGDSDWEIGNFKNPENFLRYYADNIDCDDDNGGFSLEYVFENVLNYFDKKISREEAVKIVQSNRTWDIEDDK